MADEKIVIQIQDQIAPSIIKKLKEIADYAQKGQNALANLVQATDKNAAASLKGAIQQERLKKAMADSMNATNRSAISASRLQREHAKLSDSTNKVTISTNRAKMSVYQLDKAQSQAALSALRLQNAQASKAKQAAAESAPKGGGAVSSLVGMAKGAFGAYLGFQGAKEIVGLSSAYTDLQNKLKMVTESEGQLAIVTQRVFEIADKTRVPVEDTAKAFTRFDLALKQLGASQEESLQLTETVNKMLIISGATAGEAGSSLLQLSQAFNKGKLDGDEFRSVMELMPPVADAIAEKLGVTRGELLKLAPEGKITAQVMREALASVATEIDQKFGKTIPTIGQSLIQLKNTAIEAFGVMGKESGVMTSIVEVLQEIEKWLKSNTSELVIFSKTASNTFATVSNVFRGFSTGDSSVIDILKRFTEGLGYAISKLDGMATRVNFLGLAMERILTLDFKGLGEEYRYLQENMPEDKFLDNLQKIKDESLSIKIKTEDLSLAEEQINKLQIALQKVSGVKGLETEQQAIMEKLGWFIQKKNEILGDFSVGPTNREMLGGIIPGLNETSKKLDEVKVKYQSLLDMNKLGAGSFDYLPTKGGIGWNEAEALTPGIQLEQARKDSDPIGMRDFILGQTSQEVMQEAFDPTLTMKEQYEKYYQDIEMLRANDIISEKKAAELKATFQKKELTTKLETASQFAGNMSSLMQSENKTAFKIGKAAALAQAGIDATLAVMAALAKPGGPAGIALAASIGVMAAVNMQKIASAQPPGFKEGGFTGYGGTSAVAGVVHGGEFVSNAATTARYRPMLERMQKGQSAVSVTIENYGTSKDFEVEQVTPDQIRIIARDEVRSQVPSLMASESMNPNSKFSKAMQNSTNLQRKRV